jgi:hypothetical protein
MAVALSTRTIVDANGLPIVVHEYDTSGTGVGPWIFGLSLFGLTKTDCSGTITAGGTAQSLVGIDAARREISVYNDSLGELRVSETGTASATNGISIAPGDLWEPARVPTNAISIWGATTGQKFVATRG